MDMLIGLLVFVLLSVIVLWLVDQLGIPNARVVKMVVVLILLIIFLLRFLGPYLGVKR